METAYEFALRRLHDLFSLDLSTGAGVDHAAQAVAAVLGALWAAAVSFRAGRGICAFAASKASRAVAGVCAASRTPVGARVLELVEGCDANVIAWSGHTLQVPGVCITCETGDAGRRIDDLKTAFAVTRGDKIDVLPDLSKSDRKAVLKAVRSAVVRWHERERAARESLALELLGKAAAPQQQGAKS